MRGGQSVTHIRSADCPPKEGHEEEEGKDLRLRSSLSDADVVSSCILSGPRKNPPPQNVQQLCPRAGFLPFQTGGGREGSCEMTFFPWLPRLLGFRV